mmetsp:Transcript_25581/g.81138  ORF Transcript_25581/g.81138 Transcript_25581/m.81138 type:complete len:390 (-) Transcript_25581:200-1369(-)|eukprot:CAMPEP_0182889800 /NCGR_PEP_ID=MMETSP0034_2-20130328/22264_1 /TAXON_ID=156128 /ORGANISM="Nephroselmis pyriformis, Strain CCMP717" /LENGTH=389 /DNA_ID=CAMNT_0025023317 /DNA_START=20 /DNA_END=1189 /DNA_ORIENTATION=-
MDNVAWLQFACNSDVKESVNTARRIVQDTSQDALQKIRKTASFKALHFQPAHWRQIRKTFSTDALKAYADLSDEQLIEKPLLGRIGFTVFRIVAMFTLSFLVMLASYWRLLLMSKVFLAPWRLVHARDVASVVSAPAEGEQRPAVPTVRRKYGAAVESILGEAQGHESRLDTAAAISLYRDACKLVPGDGPLLGLLSKAISDQVFDDAVFKDHVRACEIVREAMKLSQAAIDAEPEGPDGFVAHAVNLGRLAMFAGNSDKVEISRRVKDTVERALDLDPANDMALHVRARWEMEMASLGALVRAAARIAYGGVDCGSWSNAEAYLRRAVELRPQRLMHRVELAKCMHKLGRNGEARAQLELALSLPVEDINFELERRDGVKLLEKLGPS